MNLRSFFSRLCHSPIPRRAAAALVALALSSLAFCGEIHDAATSGDLEKVKTLLKNNPDLVFSKDNFNNTPLHATADKGHKDVAELLLANHAEVNAKNDNGRTPLHVAVDNGHKDVAELLLANHADVNATNILGTTPLHAAALRGYKDVAELLLTNHADVNAKDKDGWTPLDVTRSREAWQWLRSNGAETGRKDLDKALGEAAKAGIPESVAYFIQKGGNPNAKFDDVLRELRVIKIGSLNTLSLWTMEYRSITPLHYACYGGSEAVVRLLVEKGARVSVPDGDGETPLDFALFRGFKEIVGYLRSVKAEEGVSGELMHIRAAIENLPEGFHRWSNCSLMPSYDFSKEYSGKKPESLDDLKGTVIGFNAEWGGWDEEPVSFRNGMIGKCKAIRSYVKEGTEAKCFENYYRFEKNKWVEVKK